MANADQRSAAEIEREIEEERNALSRTLDEIHDRLSFEALSGEFVDRVRENGGDLGRGVARAVRDNPLPLALTAMGLAWLVANQRSPERGGDTEGTVEETYPAGHGADAGSEPAAPLLDTFGRPLPRDGSRWDMTPDDEGADRTVDEAAGRVSRAARAIRHRAEGARASAADLRRRIAHGTDEMSAEARKRVIAARTRAYEAQLKAEKYASRGREKAAGLFEEQPLVAGALALAVGAALGALLPRTRHEDGAFGVYRDRVFAEAERIYREESSRLGSVAREAAREMQDVARDVAADVGSDLGKGAQDATDVARAKLSDAAGVAEPDRDGNNGNGSQKLRQV